MTKEEGLIVATARREPVAKIAPLLAQLCESEVVKGLIDNADAIRDALAPFDSGWSHAQNFALILAEALADDGM